MRYFLLKMKTKGIKNIEDEIVLSFYPETIQKTIKTQGNNVKSIFGMNGSGKSAIMNSVDLYKKFAVIKNYIHKISDQYLNNMINKKTKAFSCELIFALYEKNNENMILDVFSHQMEIVMKDNSFKFIYEKLSKLVGKTINGSYKTIYEVKNGVLDIPDESDQKLAEIIKRKTINLLEYTSLLSLLPKIFEEESNSFSKYLEEYNSSNEFFNSLLLSSLFPHSLHIFLDEEDQHLSYSTDKELFIQKIKNLDHNTLLDSLCEAITHSPNVNTKKVRINEAPDYEREVQKLESFIRIFKPSLKSITTEKKILRDYYQYELILNYDDYSIDSEFESTGIKKLIRLFQYFQFVSNGEIVFIDELDANIHDVYLSKLLVFFANHAKGQLCYTTHNLGPLEDLKRFKNSIDFLSESGEIVQWVKNGNYSPYNQYRNGFIMGSPFNVEDFEFLKVFNSGDD